MTDTADGRRLFAVHVAVIVLGTLVLSVNAFNPNLWYDETYSVALVWHPFDEIWTIGADDVHPVLYYFALHVLYLVFGSNVIAYRFFSIAGSVVMSVLGITHLRKDVGPRIAIAYSALALLLPWGVRIALQVRMYAWLAAAFMVVAIYAWRILRKVVGAAAGDGTGPLRIPARWWAFLFLASIACAYLHYYGAMACFCVHLVVIASLVKYKAGRRAVLTWVLGAVVAVCSYLPWLSAVASQVSVVSSGEYWIHFALMGTVGELVLFPFNTPEFEHLAQIDYLHTVLGVVLATTTVFLCAASIFSYGKAAATREERDAHGAHPGIVLRNPATFGLTLLAMTVVLVMAASIALGHEVLYYRYLVVCLGPVALAFAWVLMGTASKRVGYAALACCVACGVMSAYGLRDQVDSPENQRTLDVYGQMLDEARSIAGEDVLVVSPDVYTSCILATSDKGPAITYIPDGELNEAYRAYEPRFVLGQSWDDTLGSFDGAAVFIGKYDYADRIAEQYGGTAISKETVLHAYSGQWFDYTLIDFR